MNSFETAHALRSEAGRQAGQIIREHNGRMRAALAPLFRELWKDSGPRNGKNWLGQQMAEHINGEGTNNTVNRGLVKLRAEKVLLVDKVNGRTIAEEWFRGQTLGDMLGK